MEDIIIERNKEKQVGREKQRQKRSYPWEGESRCGGQYNTGKRDQTRGYKRSETKLKGTTTGKHKDNNKWTKNYTYLPGGRGSLWYE